MSDNLTIYIPTYERHHLLKLILEYHNEANADIIVCDASHAPWEVPDHLKNSKIQYFHMPEASYAQRYLFALNQTKTGYFVPRADRRHQSNAFNKVGIAFLEKNPEFDQVQGIWLSPDELKPQGGINLLSLSGEMDSPYERITNHALSYHPSFYSIQRTAKAKILANILVDINNITDNQYVHEYILSFYSYLTSKIKQLPYLHGVEQVLSRKEKYFHKWFHVPFLFAKDEFKEDVWNVIKPYLPNENLDEIQAKQAFIDSLNFFVLRFYIENIITHPSLIDRSGIMPDHSVLAQTYHALNNNIETPYNKDALLRLLMSSIYDRDSSFSDVKKKFTQNDFTELKKILNLIDVDQEARSKNLSNNISQ